MKLIAEDLLSSIKRRSLAPISQQTFDDDGILSLSTEIMHLKLVPLIMGAREGFYLGRKKVSLTAALDHYSIPNRAIGDALVDVFYIGTDGRRVQTFPRTKVHDLSPGVDTAKQPVNLLLAGGEVIVDPIPSVSEGQLEFWHYKRPNDLVATENCAKITGVNSVGGTTTFNVDTDLTALDDPLATGDLLDFPRSSSPFFNHKEDVAITSISSSQIAVATADVQNEASSVLPAIGDYICRARETNIPMLPEEAHPLLAELTAYQMVKSLGHKAKADDMKADITEMAANFLKLISNRIEAEPEVILNRHGIFAAMRGMGQVGRAVIGNP